MNNRKLSRKDIRTIRKLSREGYTNREISKMFPVTEGYISLIVTYRVWRNL